MFTTSRRGFLQGAGALSAMGMAGGCASLCSGSCGKIRLAAVGVMGKGYSDWMPMIKSGLAELVAWCDADANKRVDAINHKNTKKVPGLAEKLAKVPFYTDYRKMLDDQSKLQIQAMTVSTPDHMHAAVAVRAMKMGIHVYVQKPLVRTIWEAHQFFDAAKANNVVTQMGNQGSGGDGFRRNVEIVQSGILGDVTEVHVWTNRPIWPQGFTAMKAATTREVVAVPPGLDWNAWLGVAAGRPYRKPYDKGTPEARFNTGIFHAFNWRGYFDFGAGAFGDMACHTMNLPFRGLELGVVTDAECTQIEEANDVAYPTKSTVKLTYAARESRVRPGVKLPEVKLYWYDGDQQKDGDKKLADLMPAVVAMPQYAGKVPRTGCLIVGSKGILCSCADYGQQAFIALKGEKVAKDVKDHEACKVIPVRIPRRSDAPAGGMDKSSGAASLAADGHYIEFLDAINGKGPVFGCTHSRAYADVEYSIPMMEAILVGTVAQQVPGKLNWCTKKQCFDNAAANTLIKPVIRKGFEF
ncbi:MAG: Gfo/Idh/MocA family oxidoreductase [Kiritimatiellae bacterium]|nr:Gfo/Idh/MocA family oxidoreductase [Kiritimatiellia bacterium]